MTTISNLNIVIQQGDTAREVQNDRLQPQHVNQVAETLRHEKQNEVQMTTVQEFDAYDELHPDGGNNQKRRLRFRKKKKEKPVRKANTDDRTGRLIDTLA